MRIGRSRWFNLLWLVPIGFVALLAGIAAAQGLGHIPSVAALIVSHPAVVAPGSAGTAKGLPAWVGVLHFLNLLFMVFIIRAGIQILADTTRTRSNRCGTSWPCSPTT